ncbi:MAG: hypothetical protein GY754_36820 [bacterium]|nr:hypothetical protein [bacterium]
MQNKLFALITFILLTLSTTAFAATQGVVTGNNVNIRLQPKLGERTQQQLFKGNRVFVQGYAYGDSVKSNKKWVKITAPYFYGEMFIHSNFILTGKAADSYIKKLNSNRFKKRAKKYFSSKQITLIKRYKKQFNSIKTDKDFFSVYRKAENLKESLTMNISKKYRKFQEKHPDDICGLKIAWLYTILPGLYVQYVAEGTEAELDISIDAFYKKAKESKGTADDAFIAVLRAGFGKNYLFHRPTWFQYTWDYGGESLLGTGKHLRVFTLIDAALKKDQTLKKDLMKIRKAAFNDMLKWKIFAEPTKTIIPELRNILKSVKLSNKEKKQIQSRIKEFRKPGKDLQINCKKKNCDYGG